MIIDVILLLVSAFIYLLTGLLSVISFSLPDSWVGSVQYFLGSVKYISGIFPVATLFSAVISILGAWITIYTIKLLLQGFSVLPWFKFDSSFPQVGDHRSNTLDLSDRRNWGKGRKMKNTRDIR